MNKHSIEILLKRVDKEFHEIMNEIQAFDKVSIQMLGSYSFKIGYLQFLYNPKYGFKLDQKNALLPQKNECEIEAKRKYLHNEALKEVILIREKCF